MDMGISFEKLKHPSQSLLFLFRLADESRPKAPPEQTFGSVIRVGDGLDPATVFLDGLERVREWIGTALEGDDLAAAIFEAGHPQRLGFLA